VSPLDRLRRGEILILPTDSVPGLHVLATLPGARAVLAARKAAAPEHAFLLLIGAVDDALALVQCDRAQEEVLRRAWPGPYTFLLRPRAGVAPDWLGAQGKIALRVPAHAGLRALLDELGAPLYSSSVNRSGEPPATDLAAARRRFPDLVAVELAGEAHSMPSTVIDLGQDEARLVRAGAGVWPLGLP
jgi:tRNA threonylcarbamoyl adenosine modification protein (Sua5/YciO/YrdC/YwlC family)